MRQEDRHGLGPDSGFLWQIRGWGHSENQHTGHAGPMGYVRKHMLFLPVMPLVKLMNLGQGRRIGVDFKGFFPAPGQKYKVANLLRK